LELADERVPLVFLDGVEESGVPLIDQHVDRDEAELDGDHGGEQAAARPAVLGAEVREGEAPDGAERGEKASHGWLLLSWVRRIPSLLIRILRRELRPHDQVTGVAVPAAHGNGSLPLV